MSVKLFLGIDPGMSGAFAIVDERGQYVDSLVVPIVGKVPDVPAMREWLEKYRDDITQAVLEQVASRPGQGVSTMFKFGRMYGMMEGLIAGLQIPYTLVTPNRWTASLHAGVEGRDNLTAKDCSQVAARRLFPKVDLRASARSTNLHDGKIDAVLIAEYCRRRFQSADV